MVSFNMNYSCLRVTPFELFKYNEFRNPDNRKMESNKEIGIGGGLSVSRFELIVVSSCMKLRLLGEYMKRDQGSNPQMNVEEWNRNISKISLLSITLLRATIISIVSQLDSKPSLIEAVLHPPNMAYLTQASFYLSCKALECHYPELVRDLGISYRFIDDTTMMSYKSYDLLDMIKVNESPSEESCNSFYAVPTKVKTELASKVKEMCELSPRNPWKTIKPYKAVFTQRDESEIYQFEATILALTDFCMASPVTLPTKKLCESYLQKIFRPGSNNDPLLDSTVQECFQLVEFATVYTNAALIHSVNTIITSAIFIVLKVFNIDIFANQSGEEFEWWYNFDVTGEDLGHCIILLLQARETNHELMRFLG